MSTTRKSIASNAGTPRELLAERHGLEPAHIVLFQDFTDFLGALLALVQDTATDIIAVGHVTPDVEIAADRAGLTVRECFGPSPFAPDLDSVRSAVRTGGEIVYLAQPNRVTGVTFATADIEALADAIPDGYLIIDEQLADIAGVTADRLVTRYPHLIVLRWFGSALGTISSQTGYALGAATLIRRLNDYRCGAELTGAARRYALTALASHENDDERSHRLHDEMLRLGQGLTRAGVRVRLTAADFLLIQVADPLRVGNALAAARVPVQNLDGYPHLKGYLRYRILSPAVNDRCLRAFERMPGEFCRLRRADRRASTLHRPAEAVARERHAHATAVPEEA